jgi:hypothetical protein
MSQQLKNSSEFYGAVRALIEEHSCRGPSLEQFLQALLKNASTKMHKSSLSYDEVLEFIRISLTSEAKQIIPKSPVDQADPFFAEWKNTIQKQIEELRKMKEAGVLDDEWRYFGKTLASGESWYNFDPLTFLECAAAGLMDGHCWDDPVDDAELSWKRFEKFLILGQIYE